MSEKKNPPLKWGGFFYLGLANDIPLEFVNTN